MLHSHASLTVVRFPSNTPFFASSPIWSLPFAGAPFALQIVPSTYYETKIMRSKLAFLPLFLLCLLNVHVHVLALPLPRGYYINCGSTKEERIGSIQWIQDEGFIAVGNVSTINTPNILPVLASVRYFPDESARKYCYEVPVIKGAKYLVRTTYYYGSFDGGREPPVFDQIVDGTRWSAVNTTESFRKGLSTYYELVAQAQGKTMSVCLARSKDTASSPFISSLELVNLDDSMYNTTDFSKYAMSAVARHRFGHKGDIVSYPDDEYNRYWLPFMDGSPAVESKSAVSPGDFWNLPPAKALQGGLTTSRGKQLTIQWPPVPLPAASYYVALYFQDTRTPSAYSWRVFDVAINGREFFKDLNVSTAGVMVYSALMPLSGITQITLTPDEASPVGPLINAGEIYQILPLGGKTATRDVVVLEDLARSLKNPPPDWRGDPCLPSLNSWTGVDCSDSAPSRVVSLNLTGHGLTGSLPESFGNLTGLKTIYLGNNNLSGPIPDMSNMKSLTVLHLDNNHFSGTIKSSLGKLDNLKELHLNNNNLTGEIPQSLKDKSGLDMQTGGNKFE